MTKFSTNLNTNPQLRTQKDSLEKSSELVRYSTNQFELVFERMINAVGGKRAADLADALGISQASVSGAKRRNNIPDSWYLIIAEKYGVSVDWLRTGEGEMRRDAPKFASASQTHELMHDKTPSLTTPQSPPLIHSEAPQTETLTCLDCELVMIPLVEAKLSAGGGSFETSGDSERRYAFRSDFLRRKGNPNAMVLMRVAGDSMEPKIEHDDVVLVDTSQTEPHLGRMYAVAVEDLVYLKQVNAEPGKLVLTSANPAYTPLEIDARGDQADGIRIIGRAIWVGRELA